MTRIVIMYNNARNNDKISFPSPKERVEKKSETEEVFSILYLTKSGSLSCICEKNRTYIMIDADNGTKKFCLSKSHDMYDKIKKSFPEHCPGYDADHVKIGPIEITINSAGISVKFDTPDYYNAFGSRR